MRNKRNSRKPTKIQSLWEAEGEVYCKPKAKVFFWFFLDEWLFPKNLRTFILFFSFFHSTMRSLSLEKQVVREAMNMKHILRSNCAFGLRFSSCWRQRMLQCSFACVAHVLPELTSGHFLDVDVGNRPIPMRRIKHWHLLGCGPPQRCHAAGSTNACSGGPEASLALPTSDREDVFC